MSRERDARASAGWNPRDAGGFDGFDAFIRHRGGIVRRSDLLQAGWTDDELRIAYGYWGRPERLRHGWYCVPELPDDVRRAWKAGGPLACISAIRWYAGEPIGEPIHIAMHDHRHPRQRRPQAGTTTPVPSTEPEAPIIHWHNADDAAENSWAVPLELAHRQAATCAAARRDELARLSRG
ncbi:hypothetical protein EV140_1308 [Microcella alkaliphila]|uniref:Uncharacterized protein n=1 Tax=Microcella alkaliphila TaxID=279828 RepID=A0A4Q7TKW0_9MICO|nr:hypothetical protein [Microcella alkaliphila]RZT60787.1 hypothetical protein EV140_1308 [Microcella alkaliphila]